GSAQPFDNEEPSLALTYLIATDGLFPAPNGSGFIDPITPFIGEMVAFAGDFAPKGWEVASGQLVNISQNTALFAILGTSFGGNGISNFRLPNLNDRVVVGTGGGVVLGEELGANSPTIDASQVPPTVTIKQAAGQTDPAPDGPILYSVVFSTPV